MEIWEKNLCNLALNKASLETHKIHDPSKNKLVNWIKIKIKNFCSLKHSVRRMKRQAAGLEKMFVNHV